MFSESVIHESLSLEIYFSGAYIFTEHVKSVKMYMVKFNETTFNRLKRMGVFIKSKYI